MALVTNPAFQESPESLQKLANLALETHVRAALRADSRTEKMQVAITADQGVVTLAGIVDRSSEPVHASEVVAALPQVKEIKNQLKIATASRVKLES
jgi:osmotically-inducible protein OsmY